MLEFFGPLIVLAVIGILFFALVQTSREVSKLNDKVIALTVKNKALNDLIIKLNNEDTVFKMRESQLVDALSQISEIANKSL